MAYTITDEIFNQAKNGANFGWYTYKKGDTVQAMRNAYNAAAKGGKKPSLTPTSGAGATTAEKQPADLAAYKANLDAQVKSGAITQAQADAEMNRVNALSPADPIASLPVNATPEQKREAALKALAGSDAGLFDSFKAGQTYGGQLAADLNGLKMREELTPEQTALKTTAETQMRLAEQEDPRVTAALAAHAAELARLQNLDPQVADALGQMRSRLGGLNSAELEAQRSNALRDVQLAGQDATRGAASWLGARNLQGGIGANLAAKIAAEAIRSRGALEADLLVKNADIQTKRLSDYGSQATTAHDSLATRRAQVLTTQQQGAQAAANANSANRISAFNNLAGVVEGNTNYLSNIQAQNLNAARDALSQSYSMPFSFGQFYTAQKQQKDELGLAQEQLDMAKNQFGFKGASSGRSRGSSGSSSTSGSVANTNNDSWDNSGL